MVRKGRQEITIMQHDGGVVAVSTLERMVADSGAGGSQT